MISEDVREKLESAISDLGFRLIQAEWKSGRGQGHLRLTIDKSGGVTVDDCSMVSREISVFLDVLDPFPHQYRLEVSSPGVQRPILSPEEYGEFVGKNIAVHLETPINNKRVLKGKLIRYQPDSIHLGFSSGEQMIPLTSIKKSHLMGPWEEVD